MKKLDTLPRESDKTPLLSDERDAVDHQLSTSVQEDRRKTTAIPRGHRRSRSQPFAEKEKQPSSLNINSDSKREAFTYDRTKLLDNKLSYYNKLQAHSAGLDLQPPKHVLPSELFLPFGIHIEKGTQSSIVTIFSLWNAMMGSSLLALPYGISEAGFGMGIVVVVFMALIAFYTGYLITVYAKKTGKDEFSDICLLFLGKPGQLIAWLSSLLVLMGAIIAYYILLSSSLYDLVNTIRYWAWGSPSNFDSSSAFASKIWDSNFVPLFVFAFVFPITNLKQLSVLLKFNTVCVLFIVFLIFFVVFQSFYKLGPIHWQSLALPAKEFKPGFFYLVGLLNVSYFIHNSILPIMKNQKNPENNTRDLFIAFMLVMLCYLAVGGAGYLAFIDNESGIMQDFISYFSKEELFPWFARLALFLQLSTILPLLNFVFRLQYFGLVSKVIYPGFFKVLILNLFVNGTGVVFAIWYPKIGDVLRFIGAGAGLIYVFAFPIFIHLINLRKEGKLNILNATPLLILVLLGLFTFAWQFVPPKLFK